MTTNETRPRERDYRSLADGRAPATGEQFPPHSPYQRPTWLADAHRRLDEAVFAAYAWPPDLTDDQILERLLALNLQRRTAEAGGNK